MKLKVLFLLIIVSAYSNDIGAQHDAPEYEPAANYGEKTELKRFLEQEMNYPKNALKNNKEGTVELFFVVDNKTGATSNLEIKTSVDTEIDAEAIRLYRLLQFQPPYYKGTKATTNSSLKIKFSIKAYHKYCKKRGYSAINLKDTTTDYSSIIYQDNNIDVKPKVLFKDTLMTLHRFIYQNLKYPEGTLRLNITGVVKLYFVVEPTGRITNIKVLKDVGGGATKEAERILKLLKWEPGWKNKIKVRTSKILEVNFNLTNDSDYKYVPGQM